MLIYLASPMDFSGGTDEVGNLRRCALRNLRSQGVSFYDPTLAFEHPHETMVRGTASRVHTVNEAVIAACSGVLALLPAGRASIGVPQEIMSAIASDRPCAVVGSYRSMQLQALAEKGLIRHYDESEGAMQQAVEWLKQESLTPRRATHRRHEADNRRRVVKWVQHDRPETGEFQPQRNYDGDAGFDLVVSERTHIPYGGFADVPCGISVELPPGVWALITGRSSTLRKRRLLVTTSVIDNGYRGPLFCGCQNLGEGSAWVEVGERIAQLVPIRLETTNWEWDQVTRLSASDRGANGFGSTGT